MSGLADLLAPPERELSPLEMLSHAARRETLAAVGAAMDMQRAGIAVDWAVATAPLTGESP